MRARYSGGACPLRVKARLEPGRHYEGFLSLPKGYGHLSNKEFLKPDIQVLKTEIQVLIPETQERFRTERSW